MATDRRNIAVILLHLDAVFQLVMHQGEGAFEGLVQVGGLQVGFVESGEVPQAADNVDDSFAGKLIDARDVLENGLDLLERAQGADRLGHLAGLQRR